MISLDRAATEHKRNMAASYPGLAVLAIISIEQAVHSTQRAAGVAANVCSTKLRSVPLQRHSQSWKGDGGKASRTKGSSKKASRTLQLLINCTTARPMGLPQITKRCRRCLFQTHPRLSTTRPQSWWRTLANGTAGRRLTYMAATRSALCGCFSQQRPALGSTDGPSLQGGR